LCRGVSARPKSGDRNPVRLTLNLYQVSGIELHDDGERRGISSDGHSLAVLKSRHPVLHDAGRYHARDGERVSDLRADDIEAGVRRLVGAGAYEIIRAGIGGVHVERDEESHGRRDGRARGDEIADGDRCGSREVSRSRGPSGSAWAQGGAARCRLSAARIRSVWIAAHSFLSYAKKNCVF
jgi:hypothetical protein